MKMIHVTIKTGRSAVLRALRPSRSREGNQVCRRSWATKYKTISARLQRKNFKNVFIICAHAIAAPDICQVEKSSAMSMM
jgi:hypothetical protein